MKKLGITLIIMITLNIGFSQNVSLNLRTYLEGPFFSNQMNTTLNQAGLIPLNQPYNVSPWNYSGNESLTSIPATSIDWVMIELLRTNPDTASQPFEVIGRRAALLKYNGKITDLNGYSPVSISSAGNSAFYVKISHRNHLTIISADTLQLNSGLYTYDFTTDPGKAYNGIWGM